MRYYVNATIVGLVALVTVPLMAVFFLGYGAVKIPSLLMARR